jgi:hypothetical protein
MIDVLHQLLKGITMYLITWVKTLASNVLPAVRKRKRQNKTIKKSSGSVQLDERFRCVPHLLESSALLVLARLNNGQVLNKKQ